MIRNQAFSEENLERWRKYWESLTGDVKHKFTKCVKKVRDAGFVDDPEAFCAALRDFVEGPEWRKRRSSMASSSIMKVIATRTRRTPAERIAIRRKRRASVIPSRSGRTRVILRKVRATVARPKANVHVLSVRSAERRISATVVGVRAISSRRDVLSRRVLRRRISSILRKTADQNQQQAPQNAAPVPQQPAAPQKKTVDLNTVITNLSQLYGIDPSALHVTSVTIDSQNGEIFLSFRVPADAEVHEARASVVGNNLVIKTGKYDLTVPLGNQTVKYDIPTRTISPMPKPKKPEIAAEGVEVKTAPKDLSPDYYGAEEIPRRKGKPEVDVAVQASVKVKPNKEVEEWADKVVRAMVAKKILYPEEAEQQKEFFRKRYASVEPLKAIYNIVQAIENPETVFLDNDGVPVDLKNLF